MNFSFCQTLIGLRYRSFAKCLKPIYLTIIAIQQKKFTAGEFFGEWPKRKVQLQRKCVKKVSSLAWAMLHVIERRESTFLSNAVFFLLQSRLPEASGTSKIFSEKSCTNPFGNIMEVLANCKEVHSQNLTMDVLLHAGLILLMRYSCSNISVPNQLLKIIN